MAWLHPYCLIDAVEAAIDEVVTKSSGQEKCVVLFGEGFVFNFIMQYLPKVGGSLVTFTSKDIASRSFLDWSAAEGIAFKHHKVSLLISSTFPDSTVEKSIIKWIGSDFDVTMVGFSTYFIAAVEQCMLGEKDSLAGPLNSLEPGVYGGVTPCSLTI